MKKITLLIIAVSVSIAISGCSSTNIIKHQAEASTNTIKQQKEVLDNKYEYTMNSEADSTIGYDSLNDMTADSEIVIEGKVLETNCIVQTDSVVTKFKLQVTDSLKGANLKGKTLELASAGGIVSVEEYLKSNEKAQVKKNFGSNTFEKLTPNEKKSRKIKVTFDSFPLIESGKEYIIFAKKDHLTSGEVIYVPVGVAQGVFQVDNNMIKPFSDSGKEIANIKDSKEIFKAKVIKAINNGK